MDQTVVSVDPFRCRVWTMHGRQEETVNEETCADEIGSFRKAGQRKPALGRRVCDDPSYDIEIIAGTRRLFVARYLKVNLIVDLRDISDREAAIESEIENLFRKDVSPYERGKGYARWLSAGLFASQGDLASALNVSASQVSRLLKLAKLPPVIVSAFDTALDIREGWGVRLAKALADPSRRTPVIRAARNIAARSERPAAGEVYRELLASAAPTVPGGHKTGGVLHDRVVMGNDGAPLFRIRYHQDGVALLLPLERASAKTLDTIQRAVADILIASLSTEVAHRERSEVLLHSAMT